MYGGFGLTKTMGLMRRMGMDIRVNDTLDDLLHMILERVDHLEHANEPRSDAERATSSSET